MSSPALAPRPLEVWRCALRARFAAHHKEVLTSSADVGVTKWDKKMAKAQGEEPPPRFIESVLGALQTIGVPEEKVHAESYG